MRIESKVHLEDVRMAAKDALQFVTDKTFTEYQADLMLQAAVERKFEIIGEALRRLSNVDPATAERVSGYRQIISFRNRLSHEYDDIDNAVVWEIATHALHRLHMEVLALLEEPHHP